MDALADRIAELEAQVAELRDRLDSLAADRAERPAGGHTDHQQVFWALEGLKQRLPEGGGAVLFTGAVPIDDERYEWQLGVGTEDLLADDWSALAGTLAALAHPVRLRLLREILGGRRTTAQLAELEGFGTTGQLYHHLRQLVSANWLRTSGRGSYTVPPERVVPLLVTLAAARR